MDDAKEFVASLLKTVRDRLGNPLVSAFTIAWLVWNFRVVLVLVGDGDGGWRAKIDYLDKILLFLHTCGGFTASCFRSCSQAFGFLRFLHYCEKLRCFTLVKDI